MRQRGYQLNRWGQFGIVVGVLVVIFALPVTRGWSQSFFSGVAGATQRLAVRWLNAANNRPVDQENADLRRLNIALTQQVETLKTGLAAAGSLDRIQQFLTTTKRQGTSAAIIGYSDDPGVNTFSISLGASDGLQVGMAVVSDTGFFIGKIISTREHVSTVRDLRDSQATVLARVENGPKSPGIVRGQRGIALRLSFIPKDDPVTAGQVVSTSGSEQLIPAGLPIGTITDLATRPGDVFQTANVYSPVRLSELTAVAVMRTP